MDALAVLGGLAAAVPAVAHRWDAYLAGDSGDPPYVAAAVLAGFVLEVLEAEPSALPGLVQATNRVLERSSPDVRNLLIVGFLESLQNQAASGRHVTDALEPLLFGEVAQAWRWLDAFWLGEMTPEEFNSRVAGCHREGNPQ